MDVSRFKESPVGTLIPISGTDGRTRASYDHFAFLPAALPETVELSGSTHVLVAEASTALGALDMANSQVPNPSLLRRPTLRREAHSTSALEGTFAPFEDVLSAESGDTEHASAELREVMNYVDAADYAFEVLSDRGLTVGLLKDLQRLLVRGTNSEQEDSGSLRAGQVVIGAPGSAVEEARFVPAPPGELLKAALDDWQDWITRQHPELPIVVQAAMAHYQFETIHPFSDGNGRIGRLVIVLQLCQKGLLKDGLLSVSPWFEQRRTDYQDHLLEVSRSGDWEGWVSFFCTAVRDQSLEAIDRVRALLDLQAEYRYLVRSSGGRGLIMDVVEELIGFPILRVQSLADRHGVSFTQANRVVAKLVEAGILEEVTGREWGRMFVAPKVYRAVSA